MTNCVSVFSLFSNLHRSSHSCITLETVFTFVEGLYTNVSIRVSLAFYCSGNNLPYDLFKKSKRSYILYCMVFIIGLRNAWRYLSSITNTIFWCRVNSTACDSLYWYRSSSCSSFCVAISAAVNGSGPVPPLVATPVFCVGTNKSGSVGRANGAAPCIVLYSAAVK